MKFSTALFTIATLATSVFSTALSPLDNSAVGAVNMDVREVAPLDSSPLEARQGCFTHIIPVLRINRNNRRDIQGDLDARRSIEWNPNRNVRVIIDFSSTTTRNRQLRYQITNRSQLFGAAIIFSNYQDTITGTVRETIRVPIGRATGMSLSPTPTTGAGCIVLDRLDGTWYAQLE
ncbi:hypothetical protein CFIO01_04648 [Colletotrichum fioriniae PJ7]|uniref:Uncharacterized protein n=1 Tax=Colletotrichum fioriniae PJ7 TaxID=1445577 RepID=A0A010PZM0_9PEZI|nr:hypothetical protein CFIO01_04648 [Colletotrichum fioriniae PJ7]